MGKIKVMVFGGPFSSGKTTLLLKVLEVLSKRGVKVGVMMNDIGPVDYKIVASLAKCPVEEVSRHCMCMKQKDLKEALKHLLKADHKVILIEEIGFGNPHRCWTTLSEILPKLSPDTELSPITVLVDGDNLIRCYQGFVSTLPPIMAQQLSEAEVVVVNKVDLLRTDALNTINEIIKKANAHAKVFYASALTGIGVENLIPYLMESKWGQGRQQSTEQVLTKRTEYFSDMVWSAYKLEFQLGSDAPAQDMIGKILIRLGERIISKKGQIVRIKAYSDAKSGKIYASLNPDFNVEYRSDPDSNRLSRSGKYVLSCVVKGLEVGDVSAAVKEAMSEITPTFTVSVA